MSKQTEALELALKKAFDLGQRYWQQADSDFTSQWRKADVTLASFNQLVEDTIREALAEQHCDDRGGFDPECPLKQEQETVAICEYCEKERPLVHAPASKPLTDEQILRLVPGLYDCLCDPWDYNNS